MARVATLEDYHSGKLLYYWGDYYRIAWIKDDQVCLCLPGCTPNSWYNPTGRWEETKPTSVTVKMFSEQILVF